MKSPLSFAKSFKHRLATGHSAAHRSGLLLAELLEARFRPFRFDASRYPLHRFLRFDGPLDCTNRAPLQIFCFWTGENEMPLVRRANLELLQNSAGVPVILIDSTNLSDWIIAEHPLHKAYNYLSLTHRSDYLRAYFLHYYGGGYCDIKPTNGSWRDLFLELNGTSEKWMIGYPEDSKLRLPRYGGNLDFDLRARFELVCGTGSMITRPKTPITYEWLTEVERRLDYFYASLKISPGGVRDELFRYPIGWTQLLADIMYPLNLKYHDRIIRKSAIMPSSVNYR